ncbi:cytochrome-c oxidase [Naematelia encephala]|uniref:Cytochrome c oxidase subunit 9, mitochondrial n=1 Tax=Naematelia encephala TaxID=71784 RepID=A0A1Y2AUJ5_9TREE|nr:cytochrome-c oxidase [Naematelia encephala]
MAIAPVVGKLRKRLLTDLSIAFGIGTAGAYAFWYGYHLPSIKKRDDFYIKYEASKA